MGLINQSINIFCCCSVTKSWAVTFQASLPFTISQNLLRFMSIESVNGPFHLSIEPFHLCHPLLLLPSIFPSIRVFSNELALPIRWPKYWRFTSASVLPMNIQNRFPLRLTGWISLQSKGLSKVFSNTTVQKHQFFGIQLSLGPTLISIDDYWKNHSFDYTDFCRQSNVSAF